MSYQITEQLRSPYLPWLHKEKDRIEQHTGPASVVLKPHINTTAEEITYSLWYNPALITIKHEGPFYYVKKN